MGVEIQSWNLASLNSSLGSLSSACTRRVALSTAPASARVCPGFSSLAVSAAVARTHASILHGACHNSWSDTEFYSVPGLPLRPKICVLSQRWRQG